MKKNYTVITCLLLLASSMVLSQKTIKPSNTVIEGYFDDERTDSVSLTFYEQRLGNTVAGSKQQVCVTRNGHFKFVVPMQGDICYVTLLSAKKTALHLMDYLVRKGDSNYLHIYTAVKQDGKYFDHGLVFTGRNCGAFSARYHTDSAYIEVVKAVPHTSTSYESIESDISHLWKSYFNSLDQSLVYLNAELEKFKGETDKQIGEILSIDYRYKLEAGKLVQLRYYWGKSFRIPNNAARRDTLKQYFKSKIAPHERLYPYTDEAKRISKYYMENACILLEVECNMMNNQPNLGSALSLIPLIENSLPFFRQKLVTSMLAVLGNSKDLDGRDSLISYATKTVKKEFLSEVVSEYRDKSLKGRDAFVFSLQDKNDRYVRLSDYRGKTVVLDFWYTGCTGCVQVGKGLHLVKDRFEKDSTVVFISISSDRTKDRWISGMNTSLYTDNRSINLYTNGKGEDHELTTYYNISSYPRLMIIDKNGKLFAFNAERPGSPSGNDALIDQINAAKQ